MKIAHIPDTWDIQEDGQSYAIKDENGQARCGSLTSRGTPCMKYPIKGRNRCKTHNGDAPRGELHPRYKHGKYGSYAPPSLKARMDRLSDTEITDLTENALLIDARIGMLVERTQGGEYGAKSSDLLAIWNTAKAHLDRGEIEQFANTFLRMGEQIRGVQGDYQAWQDILEVTKERRAIARDIHTITKGADGMMSATEVLEIVLKMADLFLTINSLRNEQERQAQWRRGVDHIISLPGGA